MKLFPRDSQPFVEALQLKLKERFGKDIEVMMVMVLLKTPMVGFGNLPILSFRQA